MSDSNLSKSDHELQSHVERVLSEHYELDREIGRGGMGIVYLARDKRLKRPVAIKLLPPELAFRSEIRTRFLREAEMAAQLGHPNIVPIYAVDEREGLVYFVMAYISGDNLAKRIHDRGALEPTEVRKILHDVGDALHYAHTRNVVHRDIKPDNILLDADSGRPMVTDFGIARAVSDGGDARLTATGIAIGTPAYMSPEQSAGDREIDGRSDLYSLGIVAYQALCGEPPFSAGNTPALLVKHLSERPVPIGQRRAGVPDDLANAVMLCLEKNLSDRFPDAASMVRALETGNVPAPRTSAPATLTNTDGSTPDYVPGYAPRAVPAYASTGAAVGVEAGEPTRDDIAGWNAPPVRDFRRQFGLFVAVSTTSWISGVFGGPDINSLTALWAIYLAYKYAKLWSDGYDWRAVFRQRKDALFADFIAETADDARAFFDAKKRHEVRERHRARQLAAPDMGGTGPAPRLTAADAAALGSGPHAAAARQAIIDRDEVIRLVESMPKPDRAQLPNVIPTARTLAETVLAIATQLTDLDRNAPGRSVDALEKEISLLEGQANPLDRVASEDRVRRLAMLKRQRRVVADSARQRERLAAKLESCGLALQNLRFDVLRLKTGAQSYQHVTSVAEQAMRLATDVESAVYVQDEMARLGRSGTDRPRGPSA
ncbi:MAG: serine/threonine protein kinase [Gemmatimonadaceae bacterium]|nr:serine/threonine protein kinase [Gemmatimonadaceae bacterium]